MEIEIRTLDEVTIVEIAGSVDSLTADALSGALLGQLDSDRARLVADFSRVQYVSSAGLRVVLASLMVARRRGGDLRLASVSPVVLRVLEISGFTSILNLFDDVDTAVSSFSS